MVGPEFVFLRVFFSYKINVILINKLQQQPNHSPNTLESNMDPQQTSKGWPNIFFSIFLFLFFSFFFFLICKKDVYIKSNLMQIAQSNPKIYWERKGQKSNYKQGENHRKKQAVSLPIYPCPQMYVILFHPKSCSIIP